MSRTYRNPRGAARDAQHATRARRMASYQARSARALAALPGALSLDALAALQVSAPNNSRALLNRAHASHRMR